MDSGSLQGPRTERAVPSAPNGNQVATTRTQRTRASIVRAVSVKAGRGKRLGGRVKKGGGPSILVQGLYPKTVQRLKERARVNGRSLELEIQEILERAAGMFHHARGWHAIRAVEAPAQPAVVFRQRPIDPRGSRFTTNVERPPS